MYLYGRFSGVPPYALLYTAEAGASPDRFLWGGVRVNFADKPHVFADN